MSDPNMKLADSAWLLALCALLIYEFFALSTGRTTLSRAVWYAQRTQYGPLLPFLAGLLSGHFFWSGN